MRAVSVVIRHPKRIRSRESQKLLLVLVDWMGSDVGVNDVWKTSSVQPSCPDGAVNSCFEPNSTNLSTEIRELTKTKRKKKSELALTFFVAYMIVESWA